MPRTARDLLEAAEAKILNLSKPDLRVLYAKALEKSLKLDLDGDGARRRPKPFSPDDIKNDFGLGLDTQLKYHIIVDRRDAVTFLNFEGNDITYATFCKKYGSVAYADKFNRSLSRSGNAHVFTYAEVLHLVEHEIPVELPPKLSKTLGR